MRPHPLTLNHRTISLLLTAVILTGTLLRYYNFEQRLSFDYDNEFFAWEAKKLVIDKKLTLIGQESSVKGIFIGPLYTYISSFFYFVWDMDPIAGGITAIFFGIMATFGLFFIGTKLISPGWGVIIAGTYQFFAFTINWDLGGSALNGMFLIPAVWFYTLINIDKPLFTIINFLAIGMGFHFHPTALIMLITSILSVASNITSIKPRTMLFAGLAFITQISPLIIFDSRHKFIILKSVISPVINVSNYKSKINTVHVFTDSVSKWLGLNETLPSPLITVTLTSVYLVAYVKSQNPLHQKAFKSFFLTLLITLISLLIYPNHVTDYYPMVIYAPSMIIFCLTLFTIFRPNLTILGLVISSLLVVNLHSWSRTTKSHNLKAKKQIVEWIIKNAGDRKFTISDSLIEKGYNTGFNYLLWHKKAQIDNKRPELIYSIVIPPDYLDTTPIFQSGDIGVVVDKIAE